MLTGFRLEFDSGDVFRATKDVQITHETQPLFLLDGQRNLVALFNEFIDQGGQPGRADSNYSAVYAGFGAGVHTIRVQFIQFEGATDTWGDSSASDSARSKLQELNHTITNERADSEAPAIFEAGEYSDSGKFSPIPVAIGETNLTFSAAEQSSHFDGTVTLYDAVDSGQAVDALTRGQ